MATLSLSGTDTVGCPAPGMPVSSFRMSFMHWSALGPATGEAPRQDKTYRASTSVLRDWANHQNISARDIRRDIRRDPATGTFDLERGLRHARQGTSVLPYAAPGRVNTV